MVRLYWRTARAGRKSSRGCTVCVSGHARGYVLPGFARASPINPNPNWNGTSTESPLPPRPLGAQFAPTRKFVGKLLVVFLIAKYVWPAEKNGINVTFATPISTPLPLAGVASIES